MLIKEINMNMKISLFDLHIEEFLYAIDIFSPHKCTMSCLIWNKFASEISGPIFVPVDWKCSCTIRCELSLKKFVVYQLFKKTIEVERTLFYFLIVRGLSKQLEK